MSNRPLAAASERLQGAPGFPRTVGRPRKHAVDGHVSGQAVGDVPQPRVESRDIERADGARVCETPIGRLESPRRPNTVRAPRMRARQGLGFELADEPRRGSVCA
jgi:hypothetical protein